MGLWERLEVVVCGVTACRVIEWSVMGLNGMVVMGDVSCGIHSNRRYMNA
jgi:hypothetical protein